MRDEEYAEFSLEKIKQVENEEKKFIFGQDDFIEKFTLAPFTGVPYSEGDRKNIGQGHVLLMAPPGAGKTDSARIMANSIDAQFSFVGFHPEMKTSDLVGGEIYNQLAGEFFFAEGPMYTHFLLADEINRGHPKTQATSLQAMEERVTISSRVNLALKKVVNTVVPLFPIKPGSDKKVFLFIATGNPFEQEGTYPIPEAQLDRFTYRLGIPPMKREDEKKIRLSSVYNPYDETKSPKVSKVITLEEMWEISRFQLRYVKPINGTLAEEAKMRFVENSRPNRKGEKDLRNFAHPELKKFIDDYVKAGLSNRANFHFEAAARALAFRRGQNFISIDDIRDVARLVMPHRILLKPLAKGRGYNQDDVVEEILRLTDLRHLP